MFLFAYVNMQKEQTLSGIRIKYNGQDPDNFYKEATISISNNKSTWTKAGTIKDVEIKNGAADFTFLAPVQAQYIKIELDDPKKTGNINLTEVTINLINKLNRANRYILLAYLQKHPCRENSAGMFIIHRPLVTTPLLLGIINQIQCFGGTGKGSIKPAEIIGSEILVCQIPLIQKYILPLSALRLMTSDGIGILHLQGIVIGVSLHFLHPVSLERNIG